MIGKLTGNISHINEDSLILDVNGVGYLVYMSSSDISNLSNDDNISIYIETYVREDNITLFGFVTENDKKLFNLLKTVQGVGPKLALTIMTLESNALLNAIIIKDTKKLQSIPGVGPKVAARIINELKDKVDKIFNKINCTNIQKASKNSNTNNIINEALAALKSLGYTDKESDKAINYVLANKANENISIENIVKQALNYFSRL